MMGAPIDLVRLLTRCRYCDRRVVEALAVEVPHGLAHERCRDERLRAGRPPLWLVDRSGAACRSTLAAELEDGAHAALRDLSGACSIIPALHERAAAFLQFATARGLVPALPQELPGAGEHPNEARRAVVALHAERAPRLFGLMLRLGRDVSEQHANEHESAREERALERKAAP